MKLNITKLQNVVIAVAANAIMRSIRQNDL